MTRLSFKRETNYDSVDTLQKAFFSSQIFDLEFALKGVCPNFIQKKIMARSLIPIL